MTASSAILSLALGYEGKSAPSGIIMAGQPSRGVDVLRFYSVSGDSFLRLKLRSEVKGRVQLEGYQGRWFPSPHGRGLMAWGTSFDDSTHLVTIWNADPLRKIVSKSFNEVIMARWLFGRNSVAVIEWTRTGPQGWILDATTGAIHGPMGRVTAIVDRPGSRRLLRVIDRAKLGETRYLPSLEGPEGFRESMTVGALSFEESSDLRNWKKVTPLSAAKAWVSDRSRSGSACSIFASWGSCWRPTLGFRDNWLVPEAQELAEPFQAGAGIIGSVADLVTNGEKVTGRFKRSANSNATFSMTKLGEVVYTLSLESDLKELGRFESNRSSLGLKKGSEDTLLGVRVHDGKTSKWIAIGLPRAWHGVFLWSH